MLFGETIEPMMDAAISEIMTKGDEFFFTSECMLSKLEILNPLKYKLDKKLKEFFAVNDFFNSR